MLEINKKLIELENLNHKEKVQKFKEIFELKGGLFRKKATLNNFVAKLLNFLSFSGDENNKDSFFKSKLHEEAFYILNHEKGFGKELGITRVHYIDKKAAKKWRKNQMKKFHADVRVNMELDIPQVDEVEKKINLIYDRMVGDA